MTQAIQPDTDILTTFCPVVRTRRHAFARVVDRDGYGDRIIVRFERDVMWVRHSECYFQTEEEKSGTLTDFHGFLTSIDKIMESAQKVEGRDSVKVWVKIMETPVVALPAASYPADWIRRGRESYLRVGRTWFLDDEEAAKFDVNLPRAEGELLPLNFAHNLSTSEEFVLWSNQYSPALNEHARLNLESYRP